MSEKVLNFLRIVGAQFAKRHASPQDEEIWLDSMIKGLRDYDTSVLARAATRIINTKTDPGFPYLAECRKACEAIVKLDASEAAPALDAKAHPHKGHADWQYRLADDLIMCGIGRKAAAEGWILSLHDFCRNNGRLPKEQWEIRKCIEGAKGFDEAYEELLRDKAAGRSTALQNGLIELAERMLEKRERLSARVLGREAA